MYVVYKPGMSTAELHLALLVASPRHGYDVKREHDAWFPQTRPLAYGQVYATLGRLVRDGLAEVVEAPREGGHERTVYAATEAGRGRLKRWLAEPASPAGGGGEDIVRKTIVAIRTAAADGGLVGAREVVARQRMAHLRKMRALQDDVETGGDDVARQLVKRHALVHLDADLRWLDEAVDVLERQAADGAGEASDVQH
jgi:DNA-binding PadR family transcriptional regulator